MFSTFQQSKNILATTVLSGSILTGCQSISSDVNNQIDHVLSQIPNTQHQQASIIDVLDEKISFSSQEYELIWNFHAYSHIFSKYKALHTHAQKYLCTNQPIQCGTPYLGEYVTLDRLYRETESQLITWLRLEDDKNISWVSVKKNMLRNIIITLKGMSDMYTHLSDVSVNSAWELDMVWLLAYVGIDAIIEEKNKWEYQYQAIWK